MYSLNQINDALKTTAESLSQVKKYLGLMDDWEVNAEHSKQYLLVSASIEPSVLNHSGTSIDYVIQLTVVDRVKHGNSNNVEVLSDTAIIYNDIVAKLKKDYRNEFILSGNVQIEPLINITDDKVSGWTGTITIRVVNDSNTCAIPIKQ